MAERLLEVRGLSKNFGGFAALTQVDFQVGSGERLGLIGPNGSGKTTLINCITGLLRPDQGHILLSGEEITTRPAYWRARAGIMRSFQIPRPFFSMSVLENLRIPMEFCGHRPRQGHSVSSEVQEILELTGLKDLADRHPEHLSQIEMRRLELARALAGRPKLLILDEVMAGLANSEVDDLIEVLLRLNGQGITVIMIEHIMRAVLGFSQRLMVLDAGQKIAEGKPDEIVKNREVEKAYLGE